MRRREEDSVRSAVGLSSRDPSRGRFGIASAVGVLFLAGCDDSLLTPPTISEGGGPGLICSIDQREILDGGPGRDGIPALTDPLLVHPAASEIAYLQDGDRVIGLLLGGSPVAVPHNIGWWHEIVNFDTGPIPLAATYCPLTGSSMVFDRSPIGGAELGVSGLLYRNNLIMYDRTTEESLWPQMERGARCGPRRGTGLALVPSIEMTWLGWRDLYPNTVVVAGDPERGFNYRQYPYPGNEDLDSDPLMPGPPPDPRRQPKERVLGIVTGDDSGIAFPFLALDRLGPVGAVPTTVGSKNAVVFWDRARVAAAAFEATSDGEALTFTVRDGRIVDAETGSVWRIDGLATSGPLAGRRLEPLAEAYVSFWFAWSQFHPQAELWLSGL